MNKNRVKAVWQLLTRLTTTLQYNPAITLPGIHPTELKNPWPRENLHTNACSTFIQNCPRELVPPEIQWLGLCTFTAEGRRFDPWSGNEGPASQGAWPKKKKNNCPKLETTKTSFSRWTGKLGTTDNGMLLSVQRKWGSSREGTQRNRKGTLLSDRNQSERAWDSRHVTSGTTETVKAGTVARGSGRGGGEHRMFRAANLDDALTAETRHYAFVKTPRTRQHQQRTLLTTMDFR